VPKLLSALSSPPDHTIIIPHIPESVSPIPAHEGTLKWDDFRDTTSNAAPVFTRVEFNDPIWILFSSGTTGKPKAIVHRAGGMLLDSLREHHLAGDMGKGDIYFYYTTPYVPSLRHHLFTPIWPDFRRSSLKTLAPSPFPFARYTSVPPLSPYAAY